MKNKNNKSPKIASWILSKLVEKNLEYGAMGDFEEQFHIMIKQKKIWKARLFYWLQIAAVLPSFFSNFFFGSIAMFKNYLLITLRNLWKQKLFSFIKISGLAIGLAVTMLILLWVQDEFSYDKFHDNIDRIFTVLMDFNDRNGVKSYSDGTPGLLWSTLKSEYPEIENATKCFPSLHCPLKYENEIFYATGYVGEPSFFEIFSFPFIKGDPASALTNPNSIVLTEETAQKYFGDKDPVGKNVTLDFWREFDLQVTGIINNIPKNSTIRLDFIIPFAVVKQLGFDSDSWGGGNYVTFILLRDKNQSKEVHEKITGILEKHYPESRSESQSKLYLQPFSRRYLHNFGGGGSIIYVYIFSTLALFILLIACINFMNLSTAHSASRMKEIGVRKVIGAGRKQLRLQFIGESILFAFISLLIAMVLVYIFLPALNNLSGKQISINLTGPMTIYFVLIALITGFISGVYPAFFLSSFQPVKIFKGRVKPGSKSPLLRKGLVVFQFSLSVFLIVCSMLIYSQLDYFKNRELGFSKDCILTFNMSSSLVRNYEAVKSKLLENPDILSMTASHSSFTGRNSGIGDANWEGKETDEKIQMNIHSVDYDYLETFGLEMVDGRFFSQKFSTDEEEGIILNEKAIEVMNIQNPIGKQFWFPFMNNTERRGKIIGIIKDYNINSLHSELMPLVLIVAPWWYHNVYIKISPGDIPKTIDFIESSIKTIVPDYIFDYTFLDEEINKLYRREQTMGTLIRFAMFLAIFVSCIGLFALAAFTSEQRTKEVGIRKALGASTPSIVLLLSKEFLVCVTLSGLIAWPVSYYVMNKWLQNFAYRINIGFEVFLFSGIIAFLISMATVSY